MQRTQQRVSRAEAFLETAVRRDVLSESGKDWLICAIDPFHDRNLTNLCGFPDQQVGFSTVSLVKQQFQVKNPIGTTDPYQVQIACHPWMYQNPDHDNNLTQYSLKSHNVLTHTGLGQQEIYPVTAYYSADGADIGPFSNDTHAHKDGAGIPADYTIGPCRVIGWGVEVYNTTADLYRSGTCVVYRQNTNAKSQETGYYREHAVAETVKVVDGKAQPVAATPQGNGAMSFYRMRRHPMNVAEAMSLSNTRVWDADKGCYITCVMDEAVNPAILPNSVQPMLMEDDYAVGDMDDVYVYSGETDLNSGDGDDPAYITPEATWAMIPYHMSGLFLTGLHYSSTFTVSINWYVERFPSPTVPSIVSLAKPSANFDPIALEFYDRALIHVPVGVPVSENGFGDWFHDVVAQVAKYVEPVARLIPGPIGSVVANVAHAVNQTAEGQAAVAKAKRKKKKAKAMMMTPPGPGVQNRRLSSTSRAYSGATLLRGGSNAYYQNSAKPVYIQPKQNNPQVRAQKNLTAATRSQKR